MRGRMAILRNSAFYWHSWQDVFALLGKSENSSWALYTTSTLYSTQIKSLLWCWNLLANQGNQRRKLRPTITNRSWHFLSAIECQYTTNATVETSNEWQNVIFYVMMKVFEVGDDIVIIQWRHFVRKILIALRTGERKKWRRPPQWALQGFQPTLGAGCSKCWHSPGLFTNPILFC